MGVAFNNPLHDEFGTWPLAYIPHGGADFGEVLAVGQAVGDGDDQAFLDAWTQAAERLTAEAESVLAKGHRASARALFLRASVFHAASYHPLYGAPVDPRLLAAFRSQVRAFDRGMALADPPVLPLEIPYQDITLPAYLIPAEGQAGVMRPLLILTNGYDGTITDMYFASAVAASRRGYHTLLFDGPGQGAMLYERGVPMRPDWEVVIRAVVDFALAQPIVDSARIALWGWSLGGYLAARGASGEPRLAALVADPGLWGMAGGIRAFAAKAGFPPAENPLSLGQKLLDALQAAIQADPKLHWSIVQRGMWVQGADSLAAFAASAMQYTLDGRVESIRCPTLLTMAEQDGLAASAPALFDALRCERTLLRFTAAEGAGGHCEMGNRSLLCRRVLDWLDEHFAPQ